MKNHVAGVFLGLMAAVSVAQTPPAQPTPAESTPKPAAEAVAPTKSEVSAQVGQAAALLQQTAASQQAQSAKNTADETIAVLQKRIAALEGQVGKNDTVSKEIEQLRKQQAAAEQQRKEAAEKARQTTRDLQLTTVTAVANRVDGLRQGLDAAKSIGSVAELTLLFRPGEAPAWTSWLDNAGRILGGGAGLVAVGSKSDAARSSATRAALGGVAVYLAGNYFKTRLQPQNKDVQQLRQYIQRVSMHKQFSADITAFNRELASVTAALDPVAKQTDDLIGSETCQLLRFRVTAKFVQNYRTAIDSYGGLISLLSDLNRISTQMKADGGWEPAVAADIERVVTNTADAIRVWRKGVLTSTAQLQSLEQLAKADPPDTTGCPPPAPTQ